MKLNFAEKLRTLRRTKNLTQEQLADLLAVSVQTVSRWENEITYPDVEMLPVIAELFDTTVDALLGVSEASKEKQTDEYVQKLNRSDSSAERTEILREAHRAFPRNTSFTAQLCEALLYSDKPTENPDVLAEMRVLAGDVLANSNDVWMRERVIYALVQAEEEEIANKLISEHAPGDNMTRSRLLLRRYAYRNEGDKERYLLQQEAAETFRNLLLNGFTDPAGDADEKITAYRTALSLLDTLTGCTDPNPVSGDGIPDL